MYCGCSHTRRLCAYPACYIFSWLRRPRPPRGLPLGRLIYRRRFILLFARFYASILGWLSLSLLLFFHMLIPVASRSSSRHAVLSCVSFHASRCVVSSVLPSCRLACSSRRFGLSSRMGAVSFCCSLVLVSPVVAVLSCVLIPSRFYLGISSRLCVLSVRLVGSSRPRPVISSSLLARWRLGFILMLGSRVRAVPFCCSLVPHSFHSSSFVRPGFCLRHEAGRWRHGHGAEAVCSRRLIRPLIVPARYSLTRCWIITGEDGHGAPFHVARRSSIACSCRIVPPIPSVHHSHLCPHPPHPKQENERDGDGGDGERGIGRDAPTRRNTRDEERDDSGKPDKTTR